MKKGVFWLIDDKLWAFPFDGSHSEGFARSGDTYNHQRLWDSVKPKGCRVAFDYYPRGRVDVTNKNVPVIYMSPHIGDAFLEVIRCCFEITEECVVRYDHSKHYQCYLDRECHRGG